MKMISKLLLACLLVVALPVRVKFVRANYVGVGYWTTPGCTGDAILSEAYKLEECFTTDNWKVTYVNATHLSQNSYSAASCSGTVASSYIAVGVCYDDEGGYRMFWYSESPGPFSVTPSGGFSTFGERVCNDGDILQTSFENPNYCFPGASVVAFKTRCDGNGNFLLDSYNNLECTGTPQVISNHSSVVECEANNLIISHDLVASTDCWTYSGSCQGSVNLVARAGADAQWEVNGVKYKIFDVTVQNTGTCSILSARLPYTLNGQVEESWGLSFYGNDNIRVTMWSDIHPGQSTTSAGLILANYGTPQYSSVTGGADMFICSC